MAFLHPQVFYLLLQAICNYILQEHVSLTLQSRSSKCPNKDHKGLLRSGSEMLYEVNMQAVTIYKVWLYI